MSNTHTEQGHSPIPLLLSRRAGAKLLGIGRCGTLDSLIKRGVLSVIVVDGREFLSRAQLEEFARTGEQVAAARKRSVRKSGGRIRDIVIT